MYVGTMNRQGLWHKTPMLRLLCQTIDHIATCDHTWAGFDVDYWGL